MPDALAGETVSQLVESLVTVHEVFEVTFIVVDRPDEVRLNDVGETVSAIPCWVTVIVALSVSATIVMVPVLWDAVVFAETVRTNVPFPVALAGETESQLVAPLLTVAVHALFEVTVAEADALVAAGFQLVCDNTSVGSGAACCVTVIVRVVVPFVTVIVPVLLDVVVFSFAFIVKDPFPVPLVDEMVSQLAALLFTLAVQALLETTSILADSP